jgi:hypothetical protein
VSDQVRFSSYNATELQPARIRYARYYNATRSETYDYPHAGVLTTPAFLARYPNTTTNRNRHRARVVQSFFLATDILKVGERPLDPTASEALVQAPTLNYGPCVTCHRINDPIAGAFRGFEAGGSWRWDPNDRWYTDMFPPGIAGEDMPASNYRSGLRWLAPRIVSDPRFVTSVVRFVFKGITGREPLSHPTDTADPLYAARAAAWNEQDRIFRAIGRRFVATNMNFKTVVVEMLRSPIFRATASVSGLSQSHTGVGSAMLLTPEQLERRVRAIAGFPWARDAAHEGGWLRNEFYLPYGGINSDTIVQRLTDPSGIVVGIAERMANEIGCRVPAADFVYPAAQRRFFKHVRLDTVPESGGQPVPGSVALIRQNIADLHRIVLGERLNPEHPEVTRTYNLFVETWREAVASGSPALPPPCHARVDPWTGAQLTAAQAIQADPHGTLRGWTSVMTYLFSDFRFLYQ